VRVVAQDQPGDDEQVMHRVDGDFGEGVMIALSRSFDGVPSHRGLGLGVCRHSRGVLRREDLMA
jgi:hypothetical protein